MERECLIYLGDYTFKKAIITRVFLDLKIPFRFIEDIELHEKVGYVFQLEDYEAENIIDPIHFTNDYLLMRNISDQDIRSISMLLDAFDCNIKRKAMLTQHNKDWSLSQLFLELDNEHEYFNTLEKIYASIEESNTLQASEYTLDTWNSYAKTIQYIFNKIKSNEEIEDIQSLYKQIQQVKQNLKKVH